MTSVALERVVLVRGSFLLKADAVLGPGLHVVVGRIGAGKSTLALALGGGLAPSSGTVRFEGVSRRIWIGSSPGHHLTGATVEDEVASWGLDPAPILRRAGLTELGGRDPFRLSRGEQQRLVLACSLASGADLLVLDEPFAPLDVPGRIALGRALEDRRGVTVVASHAKRYLPAGATWWRIHDGRLERGCA